MGSSRSPPWPSARTRVADFEAITPIKDVFDVPAANTAGTAITQRELGYDPTPPNAPIEIRRMATRGAAPY